MDWFPNEDTIIYFSTEILPLIAQRIPDVTLSVVGGKPTRKLLALVQDNPAVRVTGAVDDIRPYISVAAVYVVPLRIGGVTRIKIFERWQWNQPSFPPASVQRDFLSPTGTISCWQTRPKISLRELSA